MEVAATALWLFIAAIAVWDAVMAVRRAWWDRSSTHFQIAVICILALYLIFALVLWQ